MNIASLMKCNQGILCTNIYAQQNKAVTINFIEKDSHFSPGQIINLPYFISNQTNQKQTIKAVLAVPANWKIISNIPTIELASNEKKLLFFLKC